MIPTCPETSDSTTSTGYKTQHLGSAQQLISVFVEVLKHVLSDAKACKTRVYNKYYVPPSAWKLECSGVNESWEK